MSTISTNAKDEYSNHIGKDGSLSGLVENGDNNNYALLSGTSMSTPLV